MWRRAIGSMVVAGGLTMFSSLPRALAHGSVHEQIDAITAELRRQPTDATLYLRRGELHRIHRDWDAALADFERAAALRPADDSTMLARARLCFDAGWTQSAKVMLDEFLRRHTNHVEALSTRAQLLLQLKQHLAAAEDFTRALRASGTPTPELYIARSQALAAEGEAYYPQALRGLDEGIQRLGSLVTLQLYAIDLELKRKAYDAALARLDKVAAQSPRAETWLARRGEILQQAGRFTEARAAFEAALKAIEKLPAARRTVPAMAELQKRLREQLAGNGANR